MYIALSQCTTRLVKLEIRVLNFDICFVYKKKMSDSEWVSSLWEAVLSLCSSSTMTSDKFLAKVMAQCHWHCHRHSLADSRSRHWHTLKPHHWQQLIAYWPLQQPCWICKIKNLFVKLCETENSLSKLHFRESKQHLSNYRQFAKLIFAEQGQNSIWETLRNTFCRTMRNQHLRNTVCKILQKLFAKVSELEKWDGPAKVQRNYDLKSLKKSTLTFTIGHWIISRG